ncbi:MAG: hypothetical protein U0271_11510 [Polyangiaceae bacterium]
MDPRRPAASRVLSRFVFVGLALALPAFGLGCSSDGASHSQPRDGDSDDDSPSTASLPTSAPGGGTAYAPPARAPQTSPNQPAPTQPRSPGAQPPQAPQSTGSGAPPAHAASLFLQGQPTGGLDEQALPHYTIDHTIDDENASFQGTLTVEFPNPDSRAIDSVPLLLHPNSSRELGGASESSLTIDAASDGPNGASLTFTEVRPTFVRVALASPVAPGSPVRVTVRYHGTLRHLEASANDPLAQALGSLGALSGSGDGDGDFGLLATGDGITTFACGYPVLAPFREGVFDTHPPAPLGDLAYNGVARFTVRTTVPDGMSIVTNLVDGAPVSGRGSSVVESEGSFVRDFVLVGAHDLAHASVQHGDTRISSVYREKDAESARRALDAADAALTSYERRFGPYPYSELDVVESSLVGGVGGVEFSSLVLIAGMLYRSPLDADNPLMDLLGGQIPGMPGPNQPGGGQADPFHDMLATTLEFTVAHEVGHQYFAGIVGNDSHKFPSLDEPAAQYLAGLAMEDRYGADAARKIMDQNVKMNYAVHRMLGGEDGVVLRDTSSFKGMVEYGALVYGKAPYAYVDTRAKVGDDALHRAMRSAIDRYRFGVTTPAEWVDALEHELGSSSGVRGIFHRYLEETHGDEDLGVDDSGELVLSTMLPPELHDSLKEALATMGMKPGDLLKLLRGGLGGLGGLGNLKVDDLDKMLEDLLGGTATP